jgi:hypothetical protein
MPEVFTVDLEGRIKNRVSKTAFIEFIQVKMLEGRQSPFALVFYKENGVMPRYGLRLDLHKQSFLDHFEDGDVDAASREVAVEIAEVVGQHLRN